MQGDGTAVFYSSPRGDYYMASAAATVTLSGTETVNAGNKFTLEPAEALQSRKVYIKSPTGHFWGVNSDNKIVAETVFPTEAANAFVITEHSSSTAPSGRAVSIEVPGGGAYVSPGYPCGTGDSPLPWDGFEMRRQPDGTFIFYSFRDSGYNIRQYKNEVSLSGPDDMGGFNKFRVFDVADFNPAQDKVFIQAADGRYFGLGGADNLEVSADTANPTVMKNGFEIVRWPDAGSSTGTPAGRRMEPWPFSAVTAMLPATISRRRRERCR